MIRRKVNRLVDSAIVETLAAGITVAAVSVGVSIAVWRLLNYGKDDNRSTLVDG